MFVVKLLEASNVATVTKFSLIGKFYRTMLRNSVLKAQALAIFLIKIITSSNTINLIVRSFLTQTNCAKYLEYKGWFYERK